MIGETANVREMSWGDTLSVETEQGTLEVHFVALCAEMILATVLRV